ncbi:hypothetical protein [Actinokineospora cianjurensis]|uniref:PH (Pleckstrin Homology) domain-containing protein n=1 Tax=Actinokineospora cianjurensis TaxID=585224 RepID=A0A421B1C7_9PSEU|nr:hypothetical protein [Actinokineospora cianjurensis]RLK58152.1 hypothetical protein CLV68_4246 [Actinokineospora cianjurensis]
MRDGDVVAVVRRRGEFVLAVVAVVGLVGAGLWLGAFPVQVTSYGVTAQALVAIWAAGWVGMLPALQTRLVVTTGGLEVTNSYFRYWVPFGAVSWVQRTDEVILHLVGGARLRVAAGAWSHASRSRGNPVQREIEDKVQVAMRAAKADPGADVEVRRRLHLRPVRAVAILVLLEVVAFLGARD